LPYFREIVSHIKRNNSKPSNLFNLLSGRGVVRLMFKRYDRDSGDLDLLAADKIRQLKT